MTTDVAVAKILLECEAVTIRPEDPFRGVSGILTPIYTDGRALLSHQPERKRIGAELEKLVRGLSQPVDTVAGVVTSGIPWAAWIAAALNKPMIYVRDRAKRHGKKTQIEGILRPGQRAVIVDDVVNSGHSILNAAAAINRSGGRAIGGVAILTYQLQGTVKAFAKADLPLYTLSNLRSLIDTAQRQGLVSPEYIADINSWAANPGDWARKWDSGNSPSNAADQR